MTKIEVVLSAVLLMQIVLSRMEDMLTTRLAVKQCEQFNALELDGNLYECKPLERTHGQNPTQTKAA